LVCPAASLAVSSPSTFSRKVSSHIPPRFSEPGLRCLLSVFTLTRL
jgi:hypothetical protein